MIKIFDIIISNFMFDSNKMKYLRLKGVNKNFADK